MNPYAGFGWDPVNLRDPTGRKPVIVVGKIDRIFEVEERFLTPNLDPRKMKGFDAAVRRFARGKYGAKDITEKTEIVRVNNREEAIKALEDSGEGGSKIYFGHAEFSSDGKKAVGLDPGRDDEPVLGFEFGEMVKKKKGKPIALMCLGGTLEIELGEKKARKKAPGPKENLRIQIRIDYTEEANKRRKYLDPASLCEDDIVVKEVRLR